MELPWRAQESWHDWAPDSGEGLGYQRQPECPYPDSLTPHRHSKNNPFPTLRPRGLLPSRGKWLEGRKSSSHDLWSQIPEALSSGFGSGQRGPDFPLFSPLPSGRAHFHPPPPCHLCLPPCPFKLAFVNEEGSPSQVAAGEGVGNISSGRLLLGQSPWQQASHLQSQKCCTWGSLSQRKPRLSCPPHLQGLLSCGRVSPHFLSQAQPSTRESSLWFPEQEDPSPSISHHLALDMALLTGHSGKHMEWLW